jgi:hypothetical protein
MRARAIGCLAAASLLWSVPAAPQEKPGTVTRVFDVAVKSGMTTQYEQARKKHNEFHKKIKDTWAWQTWQVESGERAGTYVTATFGHHWKDFDDWAKNEEADGADVDATMGPFLAGGGNAFYVYMPDVSRPMEGMAPTAFTELTHFLLKQGGESDFVAAIRTIHEAIGKTNWPAHYYWYSLANGGDGPAYVLALPHKSWAEMEDLDPSFPQMLEKGLGRHDAEAILQTLNKSIASQRSELLRYRPDLSYVPVK